MMTSFTVFDNKTAKSIILEVCAKRKLQVLWNSQVLQTIPPVFKSTCTIPGLGLAENGTNLTVEGLGSTKKDSEQIAAYKMFPKIVTTGELLAMMAADKVILNEENRVRTTLSKAVILNSPRSSTETQEDVFQLSDTDDNEIQGDPIGDLITLCRRSKFPEPEFKPEEQRMGPGNVPIFTMTCFVGELSMYAGKRAKKQDAKKIAAFRVLRDLKRKGYQADDKKSRNTSLVTLPPSPRVNEEVTSSQESEFETLRSSNITIQTGNEEDAAPQSPQPQASISSPPVKRATAAVAAAEAKVDMDMETDHAEFKAKFKRKLEEEEEKLVSASSPSLVKRKYELLCGFRLICESQSENCLRFIKDFAHVFQHLPPNASLEEALMPREFQLLLDSHGGALKLLEKYAKELGAKLSFSKPLLSQNPSSESESGLPSPNDSKLIVFLTILFPFKDFKLNHQRKLVKIGEGKTLPKAKENAALEGLKLIRTMLISDDIEE